jgi:hypothetical protein
MAGRGGKELENAVDAKSIRILAANALLDIKAGSAYNTSIGVIPSKVVRFRPCE